MEQDPERRIELLAERFNVTPDKARSMLSQLDARDVSLDGTLHAETGMTLLDTLHDDDHDQERELMAAQQQRRLTSELGDALEQLDTRERYIVEQRIMSDEELSLAELGRRLGVSRERARQLEARAKRKLKRRLSDEAAVP
jgi:RNA polymerase sigma-32 factor